MKNLLLHTSKRLSCGQIVSGVMFLAYIIQLGTGCSQWALLPLLLAVVLAAGWTMVSALTYPPERKEELPRSFFWSHGALTVLAAALLLVTLRA